MDIAGGRKMAIAGDCEILWMKGTLNDGAAGVREGCSTRDGHTGVTSNGNVVIGTNGVEGVGVNWT